MRRGQPLACLSIHIPSVSASWQGSGWRFQEGRSSVTQQNSSSRAPTFIRASLSAAAAKKCLLISSCVGHSLSGVSGTCRPIAAACVR